MTILCDTTITSMCDPSAKILDQGRYELAKHLALVSAASRGAASGLEEAYELAYTSSLRYRTDAECEAFEPMIAPFTAGQVRKVEGGSVISYGLTSYGYDVTLSDEFQVFTNLNSAVIDPKRIDKQCLINVGVKVDPETGERYVLMPPNSYLLGRTREYFRIPRDVLVVCLGKSTYARSGAIVNVTPIEPGFEGNVVIEISNSTSLPARIYADEGISQFLFFRGDRPCEVSYGDRGGKYQGQTGITLPRV